MPSFLMGRGAEDDQGQDRVPSAAGDDREQEVRLPAGTVPEGLRAAGEVRRAVRGIVVQERPQPVIWFLNVPSRGAPGRRTSWSRPRMVSATRYPGGTTTLVGQISTSAW
jgi:hypothetical protein